MITREQAVQLGYGDHVHYTGQAGSYNRLVQQKCTTVLGPRGGVKVTTIDCRVTGSVQTWKTRPTEFRVPIKYGMREYGEITHRNAEFWHLASECSKYMVYSGPPEQNICAGCGMAEPMGMHFEDCRLLEPGDMLLPTKLRFRTFDREKEWQLNGRMRRVANPVPQEGKL